MRIEFFRRLTIASLVLTWMNPLLSSEEQPEAVTEVVAPEQARTFSCWAYVKSKETDATSFVKDQTITDQGGEFYIHLEGTEYRIKLSQLIYGDSLPVLKLGVHQGESTKTIFYTWADPQAKLVGVNLGWMQVGCKLPTIRSN